MAIIPYLTVFRREWGVITLLPPVRCSIGLKESLDGRRNTELASVSAKYVAKSYYATGKEEAKWTAPPRTNSSTCWAGLE